MACSSRVAASGRRLTRRLLAARRRAILYGGVAAALVLLPGSSWAPLVGHCEDLPDLIRKAEAVVVAEVLGYAEGSEALLRGLV